MCEKKKMANARSVRTERDSWGRRGRSAAESWSLPLGKDRGRQGGMLVFTDGGVQVECDKDKLAQRDVHICISVLKKTTKIQLFHYAGWERFRKEEMNIPIWLLPGGFTFRSLVNSEKHKKDSTTTWNHVSEYKFRCWTLLKCWHLEWLYLFTVAR